MNGKQINRLLDILERFATVAERWADVEYPKRDENQTAEVWKAGDNPEPESRAEYDALPSRGRFEDRFTSAKT